MAKRTERAKRAAKAAKAEGATPAQKRAAHAVIKAEKAAVALGSDIGALREARTTSMDERAKRFIGRDTTGKKGLLTTTPSLKDTIAAANQARAYADAMRRITGREKGVGTPYTGGGVSLGEGGGVDRPTQKAFEQARFMLGPTAAQKTNIDWMLREGAGDTVRDKRATWRKDVWGDTWDDKTGKWVKGDRTAALATQKGLLEGEVPDIYGTDYSKYFTGAKGAGAKGGLGGIISETPYTQSAPQDWSNLRYTYAGSPQSELGQVTQTPASRAMFGDKGAAMQPWATGQQVPAGLLNYQLPGGTQANVTYSGGDPSLFDFNKDTATTTNGDTTTTQQQLQTWQQPGWDYRTGKGGI